MKKIYIILSLVLIASLPCYGMMHGDDDDDDDDESSLPARQLDTLESAADDGVIDPPFSEATRLKVQAASFSDQLQGFATKHGLNAFREGGVSCFIAYAWEEGANPFEHYCVTLSRCLQTAGIQAITAIERNKSASLVHFAQEWLRCAVERDDHYLILAGSLDLMKKYNAQKGIVCGEVDAIDSIFYKKGKQDQVIFMLLDGDEETSFPLRFARKPYVDFRVKGDHRQSIMPGSKEYATKFVQLLGRMLLPHERCGADLAALERGAHGVIDTFEWSQENRQKLQRREREAKAREEEYKRRCEEQGAMAAENFLDVESADGFFLAKQ